MRMYRPPYVESRPRNFPNVRAALGEDYRHLPSEALDELVQQAFGRGFAAEAAESFLKTLAKIGAVAAPIVLPAVGTVIGGPAGTAIGAIGGSLASQALAGVAADQPSAPSGQPAPPPRPRQQQRPVRAQPRRRVQPRRARIAAPAAPAAVAPAPPGAQAAIPLPQATTGIQSPAGQLAAVLTRPEFLLALASAMFGSAGRATVPVGIDDVPVGALLNLSTVLGQAAASDNHLAQGGGTEAVPSYLFSESGEALCEVTDDRERAEVLLGKLGEVAAFEAELESAEALDEDFEDYEDMEDFEDAEWDYQVAMRELDA